jgi:pyrroline-5-carboxylate reductase
LVVRIAFIGGGTMAEAMIKGIIANGLANPEGLSVGEALEERCQQLRERYSLSATTDNLQAAEGADIVVLSVKPQNLPEVFRDLGGKLKPHQVVLSIVAGATISALTKGLGHPAVVRAMPNTPAQVGAGVSIWTSSPQVDGGKREAARSILRTLGEEVYVDTERYIDMATALTASGPAYVFYFIEALMDAGVYLGMPRDMARNLAVRTVLGSALLARETGEHPAQLKARVTSPGGTTAEALLVLEEARFKAAVINAVVAAYRKALKLGEEV